MYPNGWMAAIRSVTTILTLLVISAISADEAVCQRQGLAGSDLGIHNKDMEGCSLSMLQVDSKRQESGSIMSQQQRAEVNRAMFDLHATLRAHPKVAKQALHEVLLEMGVSHHKIDRNNGHLLVAAKRFPGQIPPALMGQGQPAAQTLLHKEGGKAIQSPADGPTSTEKAANAPSAPTEPPPAPTASESTEVPEVKGAQISPFGKEDTASELTKHAERTQDTLVDAVENAEVAEVKRAVFRALTRLRAASIKEFDTIARLETQAIDEYNDAHHYRVENPLTYIHSSEPKVKEDKYTSFH